MWDAILTGALSGFLLGVLPGGVIFAIIQHSLDLGWKKGIGLAGGVVVSDLCLILFVNLSSKALDQLNTYDGYISLAGVILLLILGFTSFLKKTKPIKYPESQMGGYFYLFGTGFMLNTFNPINFFMWLGITSQLNTQTNFHWQEKFTYFLATLLMVFLMEVTISYFAAKLRRWLNPVRMHRLNMGIGFIFIGLAVKLGYEAWMKYF